MASLISFVVAFVLSLVSLVYYARRRRFFAAATVAQGRVVRNEERIVRRQGRTRRLHFPVVAFEADGRALELTGTVGATTPRYQVGASVPVHFNPSRAEDAILGTSEEQWFEARLFGAFAMFAWLTFAVITVLIR